MHQNPDDKHKTYCMLFISEAFR